MKKILHSRFNIPYLSPLWLFAGLVSAGLGLLSCTERIDINTGYMTPRLVIAGYITTDTTRHRIHIGRTVPYFGSEEPLTYSDAVVTINNTPLTPEGNGYYCTDSTFYGVSGETYTLDVWVDFDDDGAAEHYTAATTMPRLHVLDSITLTPIYAFRPQPPWLLMVHFQDLPGPNYFGAHLYVNSRHYSARLQRYFLSNFGDNAAEGEYIRFPVMSYLIEPEMWWDGDEDFLVNPSDTVTVELNVLSKEYFDFVRTAKDEINGGNPLFAGPPANIPSNISGGALGVFGAYTTSRRRLILPDEEYW